MATFSFEAKSFAGEEMKGSREAKDKYELAQSLRSEGYVLIKADEGKKKSWNIELPSILSRISTADKMLFARNLGVIVQSGLALSRGLEILAEQTSSKKFKAVISDVSASIRKGESFSDALARHPKVFSKLFSAMVAAGEKTGKLDDALKLISHQLKRDYDLKRKIRGAMMYPIIIIIAMIVIGVLMLIYVVPTLVQTFEDLKVPLPMTTQVVIAISNFITHDGILAILFVIIFTGAIYGAVKSNRGKRVIDFILLKIPVIGGLVIKTNAARTCRTLGSLVGSGVEILEAFKITEGVLINHYYKDVLASAKTEIEKGAPISKIFIQNPKIYPILVGEMMAVGEETGKLSEMLFRLAIFYESEVAQATKDLSTIIEPILMILIGIVVGFFALSMIVPLYNLAGSI